MDDLSGFWTKFHYLIGEPAKAAFVLVAPVVVPDRYGTLAALLQSEPDRKAG
jgi:hypothetical protein